VTNVATTSASGPAWLGIGAQRSGTTWFTDLLIQHPKVDVGLNGKKEQHSLYRHGGLRNEAAYLRLFNDDDVLRGEWTPRYLRSLSTPPLALRLCRPQAPFLVLLRDPVERFASSMRQWLKKKSWGKENPFGFVLSDAHWAGMYADQLDAWARVVGRHRLRVLVYESVRDHPESACQEVWRWLGMDPVPLATIGTLSKTAADHMSWDWPEGLKATLTALYSPQVRRLRDDWQLDVSPWQNFQHI
jgi:hypothetical protein